MYIAQQKKKENISEYILYMWQVEDIIRALEMNPDKIRSYVAEQYGLSEDRQEEVTHWYLRLCDEMKKDGKQRQGHCKEVEAYLEKLEDTHQKLLKAPAQALYNSLYYKTLPYIVQLRSLDGKSQEEEAASEVNTAFVAVYGLVTLRMQGKEVSQQTLEAVKVISTFLAMLADRYHAIEEGEIKL